jgi:hypothetical protein
MSKLHNELKNEHWFKFYYLRMLVSCSGWKDDEFGAYVKLLIHQFDKGFVPTDEKELKKLITTYNKNWNLLKSKFTEDEPGKLRNGVMSIVRDEYDKKKEKGKENGSKGGRPKKEKIETKSKPNGFQNVRDNISVSISDFKNKDDGLEEENNETFIVPYMLATWKDCNPKAFIRLDDDNRQLMEIANKMKEWMQLEGDVVVESNAEKIKKRWEEMCRFLISDNFLRNYSLVQINSHLPSVIQSFNNGNKNGSHRQDHTHRAVITGTATGAGSL